MFEQSSTSTPNLQSSSQWLDSHSNIILECALEESDPNEKLSLGKVVIPGIAELNA